MADLDHVFQKLCHEAALACGADPAAIERYVLQRIETMDPADQARVKRDLDLVLSYRAPMVPPGGSH